MRWGSRGTVPRMPCLTDHGKEFDGILGAVGTTENFGAGQRALIHSVVTGEETAGGKNGSRKAAMRTLQHLWARAQILALYLQAADIGPVTSPL